VEESNIYFLLPVAWFKVSVTAWPALLRPCDAESRIPPPCFWAESPPLRVESPSFWVVDLLPSGVVLVVAMVKEWERKKGRRTRLDSRGGLVAETGDGLASLLTGGLLGLGSD
jgi:hypothetical protein